MAEEEASALPLSVQIQSLSDRVAACAAWINFGGALLGAVRTYSFEPLSEIEARHIAQGCGLGRN